MTRSVRTINVRGKEKHLSDTLKYRTGAHRLLSHGAGAYIYGTLPLLYGTGDYA